MDTIDMLINEAVHYRVNLEDEPCPDSMWVLEFLSGSVSEKYQSTVQSHVDRCPLCSELMELHRSGTLKLPLDLEIPPATLNAIRDLVPAPASVWSIFLRLAEKGLTLIETSGFQVNPFPVPVRSGEVTREFQQDQVASDYYVFEQALKSWRAQIGVRRQPRASVEVTLSLAGMAESPDGFQVELWNESRLHSIRNSVSGSVTFPEIRPGHYRLVVTVNEQDSGEVHLGLLA